MIKWNQRSSSANAISQEPLEFYKHRVTEVNCLLQAVPVRRWHSWSETGLQGLIQPWSCNLIYGAEHMSSGWPQRRALHQLLLNNTDSRQRVHLLKVESHTLGIIIQFNICLYLLHLLFVHNFNTLPKVITLFYCEEPHTFAHLG